MLDKKPRGIDPGLLLWCVKLFPKAVEKVGGPGRTRTSNQFTERSAQKMAPVGHFSFSNAAKLAKDFSTNARDHTIRRQTAAELRE